MVKFLAYNLLLTIAYTVKCGVGSDWSPTLQPNVHIGRELQDKSLRGTSLSSIRLHFEYSELYMNQTEENIFKYQVMTACFNWFSNLLSVYPLIDNLSLKINKCNGIQIPQDHKSVGLPVDFILYIHANNNSGSEYIARGGACAYQANSPNNVLAGSFEVNLNSFLKLPLQDQIMVSIHEITHALVFAPELFDLFKKPNGLPYSDDEITKDIYFPNREKWVTILTLPTVISKAREIFDCESLEGIELEDYGGSGSAGSHWDMRILPGDYMSPQLSFESVFSAITLALFQDSGWYDVNFDYSQQILWGHKAGCGWLEDKCFHDENPKFSGFCKPSNRTGCDVYHLSESFCASKLVNNIPINEQYFNDPDLGGSVSYADFCPYMYPFGNRKCRELSSLSYPKYYGESVGVNSRCIESTLLNKRYKFSSEIKGNCYEIVNCTSTYATLRVGDQEVNCPFDGGNITVKGYNGVLICPDSDVLCSEKPCFHACSGQGKCINGKCQCNPGFEGDDCTPGCDLTCKLCKGPGKFNCSSCWEGADLINGSCSCRPGTEFSYYKKICIESSKVSFSVNSEKLIVITLLYLFF